MYFSCRKTRFFATKLACVARKGRMRFGASSPVPFLDHSSAAETLIAKKTILPATQATSKWPSVMSTCNSYAILPTLPLLLC